MNSEISWRWLDSFKKITYFWLAFWRGIWKFLPDSFNRKWVFFWKNIGYWLPSSPFLITRMLKYVDWKAVGSVVELGWGTWVMTRAIISKKEATTKLTTCEIEQHRYEWLKQYHADTVNIIHLDAASCLGEFREGSIDLVVSTLPLGSLKPHHTDEILKAIHRWLSADGIFIQYQYFATNKDDIEKLFVLSKTDWEPFNFPPAFVFVCKKR